MMKNICAGALLAVSLHLPVLAQDQSIAVSSSDLPVVLIDPMGQTIWDSPKIIARMGIIDNGVGMRNDTTDVKNNYNGYIGIEIRGSSSQMFPKKQYGVELTDATGSEDQTASLMGLPEEEDWILFAPYNDKSLMRDVLAYKLGRDMGRWTPRTRYCELFIKKYDPHRDKVHFYYQGIYVLIEKIKRDENRVDIAKLNPDEVSGDDVTGGYIFKIDKSTGSGGLGWSSPYPPADASGSQSIFFQYDYPKYDEIANKQRDYIVNYVTTFEKALKGENFSDKVNGYAKYIDVESFVDFMIMQEVTRNVDGYRLSTYLHKQKDSDGGKLVMGPLWDFNLGFGNADYCSGWQTSGWMYSGFNRECPGDFWLVPFWWKRLMEDYTFRQKLGHRWQELRQGKFSTEAIHDDIDSIYAILNNEAAPRNFQAWETLGRYIWPNKFVGQTYDQEIQILKNWIAERMVWLDSNMPRVAPTSTEDEHADVNLLFYPNPIDGNLNVEYQIRKPGTLQIRIVDVTGRVLQTFSKAHNTVGKFEDSFNVSALSPGIHFARVQLNNGRTEVYKLIKRAP